MPSIELSMNVQTLALVLLAAGLIGYVMKNRQLQKKQMKILDLRKEMVSNHAQILDLQKDFVALEMELRKYRTAAPVLTLKTANLDEEKKVADGI